LDVIDHAVFVTLFLDCGKPTTKRTACRAILKRDYLSPSFLARFCRARRANDSSDVIAAEIVEDQFAEIASDLKKR